MRGAANPQIKMLQALYKESPERLFALADRLRVSPQTQRLLKKYVAPTGNTQDPSRE